MEKLKIAIIGCGRIAQRHAEHIVERGILSAVCDIKLDRAKILSKKYGARAYSNINDLVNNEVELDLISICTPNGLHAEHSIKALNNGFNVLCEKPMALSVKECKNMIQASKKNNRKLFIVKQNRFNPPVLALKGVIDGNYLGKIFSIQLNCFWNRTADYYRNSDWKGSKKLDGGTLFTQFSHFIDLLYWMFGDIDKVVSYTKNYNHKKLIEFEDTGVCILKFSSGAIGTINYTVNSFEKNLEGSLTVFGETGTVKIGGEYLNVLEYQKIKDYKIPVLHESRPANDYGFYQGSMSNHDKVYDNIIDVISKKGKIATTGEEGLKTVEIIEKIYNTAK